MNYMGIDHHKHTHTSQCLMRREKNSNPEGWQTTVQSWRGFLIAAVKLKQLFKPAARAIPW